MTTIGAKNTKPITRAKRGRPHRLAQPNPQRVPRLRESPSHPESRLNLRRSGTLRPPSPT